MRIAFTGHRPNKLGGYGESKVQTFVRALYLPHSTLPVRWEVT